MTLALRLSIPEHDSSELVAIQMDLRRGSLLVPILQATGCKRIKQSITEIRGAREGVSRISVLLAGVTSTSRLSRCSHFWFSQ